MPRRKVYFDTNTLFDLTQKRCGVTDADAKRVLQAKENEEISVLVSMVHIEEVAAGLTRCPQKACDDLKYILSLANPALYLRWPLDILAEQIDCYARDSCPESPYMPPDSLQKLRDPNLHRDAGFLQALEPYREQRLCFVDLLKNTYNDLSSGWKNLSETQKRVREDFADWWGEPAEALAGVFAKCLKVFDECEQRGIQGLLQVRSVRLCVGYLNSLIYSHVIDNKESTPTFKGWSPRPSDWGDALHAICAADTDVFVTGDGEFAKVLDRIEIPGLEVVKLPEFLERLGN